MVSYQPLTEKYYEDFALIRHPNVFQKYIDCVARLNELPFQLDITYEVKQQQRLGWSQEVEPEQPASVQPAQVLANIGSLFSSFLKPNEGGEQPKQKGGLFGFNVFN